MINRRDIIRLTGATTKAVKDAVILPGSQVFTTIYNTGLPAERKIESVDEVSKSRLSTAMFVQPFAWPGEILGTTASVIVVTVSDSVQSGAGFFVTMHNAGLPENEKIKGEDKRHIARIIGPQAWPGIASGVIAGCLEVIAYDSLRSGAGTFVYAYNFKMPDELKIECINDIEKDPRNRLRKFGPQAWPGIGFGAVASVIGITVADSAQSGSNAFVSAYNLGLPDNQQITSVANLVNDSRPHFRKFGLQAWLGIALGSVAAVPAILVSDSLKSCASIFTSIVNAGIPDAWKMPSSPDIVSDPRHVLRKVGPLAWPGILMGGIGGLVSVSLVDSVCSSANMFVSINNLGLEESDKIKFISGIVESHRHPLRKYFIQAWPGIAAGLTFGAIDVVITDTVRSASAIFASIYNTGLPDNQRINCTEIQKNRRHSLRIFGPQAWPGLVLGGAGGVVVATFVDSFKTAAGLFTTAYNLGLAENQKITRMNEIQDDARHLFRMIGPQAWPGVIIGGVGGLAVVVGADSIRAAAKTFTSMYNAGLPEDLTMTPYENEAHWLRKNGPQAWPGYLLGGIGAVVAITVTDSMRSFRSAFTSTLNLGVTEKERITCMYNLATDPRDLIRKIGPQAWPGIAVGALAALPIISIVDSFRSCFQLNASIYNAGLPNNEKMIFCDEIQKNNRHGMKKYGPLAWPGLAAGAVLGITCGTIADSFKSGFGVFKTIYNVGLPNDQIIPGNEIQKDSRAWYRIAGPQAWPGLVIGVVSGVISATLVDSVNSGTGVFTSIYNAGLPDVEKLSCTEIQNDTRKWYRIGGPQAWLGLAAGTVTGLAGSYLVDNVKSGRSIYTTIVNKVLADQDKITSIPELTNDQRHWLRIYGAVFGIGVGGALGELSVFAIKSGRFTVDAFQSWRNLSGSIMNIAIERPYFAGLSQARPSSEDTVSQSIAKYVGYGLAVPTTGIVGSGIYLGRKVPDALLLTAAVICSPVTSLVKGIAYLVGSQPRFPANLNTDQMIEQAFKDIYSSLDALGRLPVGKNITTGNGSENGWSVFRKCMTFNSKTPTEVTLDALLDAFRMYKDKSFFTDKIYNDTIDGVKSEYRKDWFSSQQQLELSCQEVQDISDFVLNYMGEAKVVSVEKDFYTRREITWNTLFFVTKPQPVQQRQEQVQEADMDLDLVMRPT